jgi:hypothetical protein
MTATAVATVLFAAVVPPAVSWTWRCLYRPFGWSWRFIQGWLGGCVAGGTGALIQHEWAFASGAGLSAAIAVVAWGWRRRRDRRKALAALGAKAKARIEAMKQAMRERSRPRPVLRPGLQGAR